MTEFKVPVCDAVVLMRDDIWGQASLRCESAPGHGGAHSHAMTACVPLAELTWWNE